MAHKKGMGSTRNGRDSGPKHLGVKVSQGQPVRAGTILIQQRGTRFAAGWGVGMGKDNSLYAKIEGRVIFPKSRHKTISVVAA